MSNLLSKDKKKSDLQIALDGEDLAKDVLRTVNDEKKIPKRQRLLIGKRVFDNAFDSIENLRAANMIKATNQKNFNKRINLGINAQASANKLNTDLRLLSSIIIQEGKESAKDNLPDWYDKLMDKSIKYEKGIDKWLRGEYDRNKKYLDSNKSKNKNKEDKSNNNSSIVETKTIPFPNIDVNDSNYISEKIN